MRRRELVLLLGGTMIATHALRAQQKATPLIGWLSSFSAPRNLDDLSRDPAQQGLRETGYVEGQNMAFEYRWAEGHYDRPAALAADLVSRRVDAIVTSGGTPTALAAKGATSTIPIVFTAVGDPVRIGLVASLARPGGNVTGFSNITIELMPKLLELVSELVPQAGVIALLVNPLAVLKAGTESEIDAAFASLVQLQAGSLAVDPDAFLLSRRAQLVALASRHAVPAIYPHRQFVAAGGLISYGIDDAVVNRQAGIYAGRILKGAKPADLPVQQPTTFELVINLKVARELGLTVPPSILARADEVIE